jgi:tripartite-type tricarboxylate transporter receptor subunit TctC
MQSIPPPSRIARRALAVIPLLALGAAAPAAAQEYPARAVRMIVPLVPGGSVDTLARVLAQKLGESLGRQFVVDNRGGASGNIGTEIVARAAPDGYTLMTVSMTLVVNPFLFDALPFDVERDLAPISLIGAAPLVLVVHPSVQASSVQELLALAKKQPGRLNYASGGKGTNSHLPMELFKNLTGANIVHVPYRGGGPAQLALIAGEAEVMFVNVLATASFAKTGKLRPLAVSGSRRSNLLPDLPTIAEAGVAGYEFTTWYGVLAPAKTPAPIIRTLHTHIVNAVRTPELAQRFAGEGAEGVASTPAQFAAHIKSELARWSKVVKAAEGLRAD